MSIVNTKAVILRKLQDMGSLKYVYDYEKGQPEGYPFATLTLREGEGQFADTQKHLRRRSFNVRVYQERTEAGQGASNAERLAAQCIDELETAFDMDITLSGNVKWARPVRWTAGYVEREVNTRVLDVIVDTMELTTTRP